MTKWTSATCGMLFSNESKGESCRENESASASVIVSRARVDRSSSRYMLAVSLVVVVHCESGRVSASPSP